MAKTAETNVNSINILVSNTEVRGEITSDGDFRIDGTLKGSLSIKGKLVVGASGKIEGDVVCQNADISGAVNGNIVVNELITLQASSKVNGDISVGKLSIEPGAIFSGNCQMNNGVASLKNDRKEK